MAQTGYTPISIYYSSTTTNVPTAGNLVAGELAINTADGKLFYKDSSGVVQVIASRTGVAAGSNTQVQYNSSGSFAGSANFVWDNANTRLGIGTSSPTTPLEIRNDTVGQVLTLTSSSANIYGLATNGTISTYTGGVLNGIGGFVGTSSNHDYIFRTNNTERMRIDASGNVGIGTTSIGTATKLQVNGRGIFTGGASDPADGSPAGVVLGYNTGSSYGFIQAIQTGVATKDLYIQPTGSNSIVIGLGGGQVYVGGVNQNASTGTVYSKNTAKAYVQFTQSGTTVTVNTSFNVTSLTRTATGEYDVAFTNALPTANSIFSGYARINGNGGQVQAASNTVFTTTTLHFGTTNSGGSFSDPLQAGIVVFSS